MKTAFCSEKADLAQRPCQAALVWKSALLQRTVWRDLCSRVCIWSSDVTLASVWCVCSKVQWRCLKGQFTRLDMSLWKTCTARQFCSLLFPISAIHLAITCDIVGNRLPNNSWPVRSKARLEKKFEWFLLFTDLFNWPIFPDIMPFKNLNVLLQLYWKDPDLRVVSSAGRLTSYNKIFISSMNSNSCICIGCGSSSSSHSSRVKLPCHISAVVVVVVAVVHVVASIVAVVYQAKFFWYNSLIL